MIVVADTTPLNYLIKLGYPGVLRELYGRVVLPPAVLTEMSTQRLRLKRGPELRRLLYGLKKCRSRIWTRPWQMSLAWENGRQSAWLLNCMPTCS